MNCLLCRRPAMALGLCVTHYKRYHRGLRGVKLHAPIAKRRKASDVRREILKTKLDTRHRTR